MKAFELIRVLALTPADSEVVMEVDGAAIEPAHGLLRGDGRVAIIGPDHAMANAAIRDARDLSGVDRVLRRQRGFRRCCSQWPLCNCVETG